MSVRLQATDASGRQVIDHINNPEGQNSSPTKAQKAGNTTNENQALSENKTLQFLKKYNNEINYAVNGGSSALNLLTFINGNFPFAEPIQEGLETISKFYTKCATGTQGFLTAIENYNRENLLPFIGNILEIPIAIFSSGYNLWLSRGVSQGLSQFQRIFEKRPLRDKEGNPICGEFLTRDFSKSRDGSKLGWIGGLTAVCKEIPKILKELFKDPLNKIKDSTHLMFFFSLWQIVGALTGFTGLDKLGAGIRNIGGAAVDVALMQDKNITTQSDPVSKLNSNKKTKTDYAISGSIWIGAEIVDFFKRFDFFSNMTNNLTNLSLFFDRLAATFMTKGNLAKKNKVV